MDIRVGVYTALQGCGYCPIPIMVFFHGLIFIVVTVTVPVIVFAVVGYLKYEQVKGYDWDGDGDGDDDKNKEIVAKGDKLTQHQK